MGLVAFVAASRRAAHRNARRTAAASILCRWKAAGLLWCWEKWAARTRTTGAAAENLAAAIDAWRHRSRNRAWRLLKDLAKTAGCVRAVLTTWQSMDLRAALAQWRRRAEAVRVALDVGRRVLKVRVQPSRPLNSLPTALASSRRVL